MAFLIHDSGVQVNQTCVCAEREGLGVFWRLLRQLVSVAVASVTKDILERHVMLFPRALKFCREPVSGDPCKRPPKTIVYTYRLISQSKKLRREHDWQRNMRRRFHLHLRRVLSLTCSHNQILTAFHPQINRVIQAIGFQRIRPAACESILNPAASMREPGAFSTRSTVSSNPSEVNGFGRKLKLGSRTFMRTTSESA
jgi:hypothetical protein